MIVTIKPTSFCVRFSRVQSNLGRPYHQIIHLSFHRCIYIYFRRASAETTERLAQDSSQKGATEQKAKVKIVRLLRSLLPRANRD